MCIICIIGNVCLVADLDRSTGTVNLIRWPSFYIFNGTVWRHRRGLLATWLELMLFRLQCGREQTEQLWARVSRHWINMGVEQREDMSRLLCPGLAARKGVMNVEVRDAWRVSCGSVSLIQSMEFCTEGPPVHEGQTIYYSLPLQCYTQR
jgi:hypothetical protein